MAQTQNMIAQSQEVKQKINELQYITEQDFETLNQKIQATQEGINEITTSGIKLDFDTMLILENIQAITTSSQNKITSIQDYLKGELSSAAQPTQESTQETTEQTTESEQEIIAETQQPTEETTNQTTEQTTEGQQETSAETESTEEIQQPTETTQETTQEPQQSSEEQGAIIDTQAISEQISQDTQETQQANKTIKERFKKARFI